MVSSTWIPDIASSCPLAVSGLGDDVLHYIGGGKLAGDGTWSNSFPESAVKLWWDSTEMQLSLTQPRSCK